jgi:uncharacterized protein YjbJ (UPF0337 family)
MNNDTVKGTIDDAAGRAKRQVGEWTGDSKAQSEGTAQQIKGKVEKVWGDVKDAVHDAGNDIRNATDRNSVDRDQLERERLESEKKHHEVIGS